MYIPPSTDLFLLKNIPIDPNYEHTLYFSSPQEQQGYFTRNDFRVAYYSNITRVEPTNNTVMLEGAVDALYSVNYMMFRNSGFGTKYFYAFVDDVEYINNRTVRVHYTIDLIQTWFFEHSIGQCFVEREHSATDAIGDNLVPEDLEFGEYLFQEAREDHRLFDRWKIGVLSTVNRQGQPSGGKITMGLYTCAYWYLFDDAAAVDEFINALTDDQKSNAIISIMMIPYTPGENINTQHAPKPEQVLIKRTYYPNGYVPRNNKLCTAPYTQMMVTDYQGHAASYAYEYMNDGDYNYPKVYDGFEEYKAMSTVPQFACVPLEYKGMGRAWNEALLISDLPQCAYAIDGYRAWMAMASNRVGVGTDLAAGVLTAGGAVLEGVQTAMQSAADAKFIKQLNNPISQYALPPHAVSPSMSQPIANDTAENWEQFARGATQITKALARYHDVKMLPPQAKSIGGGSLILQCGQYGFHYMRCYIKRQFAERIDAYFDMYGYATNIVKYPNIRNHPSAMRPAWNYIRTIGCRIDGTVPATVERALCGIYDKGVTFWSSPWDVCNYTQNNQPKGG